MSQGAADNKGESNAASACKQFSNFKIGIKLPPNKGGGGGGGSPLDAALLADGV